MQNLIKKLNPFAPWFSFPGDQTQIIIIAAVPTQALSEVNSNPSTQPAASRNPNLETQLLLCKENWGKLAETEPLNEDCTSNTFWVESTQAWMHRLNEGKAVLAHVCIWVSGGATVFFEYPEPEALKIGLPEYFQKNWMRPGYDEFTHRRRVYRLDEIGYPIFDLAIVSPEDKAEMKRKQNKYAFFVDETSIKKETGDDGSNVKNKKSSRGK